MRELAMKPAEAMLKELVRYVRPPRGCAIVLTEWKPSGSKPIVVTCMGTAP